MPEISGEEKLQRLVSLKMLSQRRQAFGEKTSQTSSYRFCTSILDVQGERLQTSKHESVFTSFILQLKHSKEGEKKVIFILSNFLEERKSWCWGKCTILNAGEALRRSVMDLEEILKVTPGPWPHLPGTTSESSSRASAAAQLYWSHQRLWEEHVINSTYWNKHSLSVLACLYGTCVTITTVSRRSAETKTRPDPLNKHWRRKNSGGGKAGWTEREEDVM